MTKTRVIGLACGVLVLGLIAALWQEWPRWRPGGTSSMPTSTVAWAGEQITCPGQGAIIAIFGDSHVVGSRMADSGKPSGKPFGKILEQKLAGRATVALYGIGEQTAAMGEARWQRRTTAADVVILAYGTNDAAPRGWLSDKSSVPVAAYKASLMRQIEQWRVQNRQVILLAPPPGGSVAIRKRVAPYRKAAQAVGQATRTTVLDPADAFAACTSAQPLLVRDALHMNPAGHQCLGEWLAHKLCPHPL